MSAKESGGPGELAKTSLAQASKAALLAALRGGKPAKTALATAAPETSQPRAAATLSGRPRLLFAIDATASREAAWTAAREVTDSLFSAVPGELDVALAVHSGGRMSLFTQFYSRADALRDDAAAVRCKAGYTRLLEILEHARGFVGIKVVVYVGDNFEENEENGMAMAVALRTRGTRLVVLHDASSAKPGAYEFFSRMTSVTGGCVLPFDITSRERLKDILASLATLAVGGYSELSKRSLTSAGAKLLLSHMPK